MRKVLKKIWRFFFRKKTAKLTTKMLTPTLYSLPKEDERHNLGIKFAVSKAMNAKKDKELVEKDLRRLKRG